MEPYMLLIFVMLILVGVILGLVLLLLANQSIQATQPGIDRVNRSVFTLGNTLSSNILSYIVPNINATTNYLFNVANTIKISNKNLSDKVQASLNNSKGVNSNLSQVSSKLTSISGQINSLTSSISTNQTQEVSGISSNIVKGLNKTDQLIQNLSLVIQSGTGIGNLNILTTQQNIPTGSYFYGQMLGYFSNHVNFSTNKNITYQILTIAQYVNFSRNKPYSTVKSNQNATNINQWFNQSIGCNQYVYVIYAGNYTNYTSFTLNPRIQAKYNPSPTKTGVC